MLQLVAVRTCPLEDVFSHGIATVRMLTLSTFPDQFPHCLPRLEGPALVLIVCLACQAPNSLLRLPAPPQWGRFWIYSVLFVLCVNLEVCTEACPIVCLEMLSSEK